VADQRKLVLAALGAVGIVFGDIGTSPLYALNQIFYLRGRPPLNHDNVLGGISLVFWTLTLLVCIKYAIFVLKADNDGEGGVFALYGLLHGEMKKRGSRIMLWALIMGAGLLFGDGLITPAISVLSAVEGLSVATPSLAPSVIPITLLLLTVLFALQPRGTHGISKLFSPILVCWFLVIGVLGAVQIVRNPGVLLAIDPIYGFHYLQQTGWHATVMTLGAVMLCATGGEAMFADLGLFGIGPIQLGWFGLVYPALLLNYFGQGAYLLGGAAVSGQNLFYSMVPGIALYPMVVLATLATVIASQALISGAFALTAQAVHLGLFPRVRIVHTHSEHTGHIYIGVVNWTLYVGCVLLVLGFESSRSLAAAYGLSVAGDMVITSVAMLLIAHFVWDWGPLKNGIIWGGLALLNSIFLVACSAKFLDGGYVPISIGIALFAVMITWQWGRKATSAAYSRKRTMSIGELVALHRQSRHFIERNAILMIPRTPRKPTDHTPALLQLIWDRYGVLPRNLFFVTVNHPKVPYVHDDRYHITVIEQDPARGSIISVIVNFGFMEEPNVENLLEEMAQQKEIALPTDRHHWVVHVAHENLLPSRLLGWRGRLRLRLFQLMRTLSQPTYYYYGLGAYVQLSSEIMPVHVH